MGLLGFRLSGYTESPNPHGNYSVPAEGFPYQGFMFDNGPWSCPTAAAKWTVHVGRMFCQALGGEGSPLGWSAKTYAEDPVNGYEASIDMLDGELHCFQSYWDLRDIDNVEMRMVHDGKTVVHVTGIDLTGSVYDLGDGTGRYSNVYFNAYSNRSNLNPADGGHSTQPAAATRKIFDNYTIRNNTPRPCSKTGFPESYDGAF